MVGHLTNILTDQLQKSEVHRWPADNNVCCVCCACGIGCVGEHFQTTDYQKICLWLGGGGFRASNYICKVAMNKNTTNTPNASKEEGEKIEPFFGLI